jgi:glucosamine--fructose-6-phosphate aminotransferase (isomerizing)
MSAAGSLMAAEIGDQPAVWRRVLGDRSAIHAAAARIAAARPRFVLLVARGSSDHAALFAKYLAEIRLQLPAGLVSPSTFTLYGAQPDLRGALLIAVSQSGASTDLLRTVEIGRRRGALTLAVTNSPDSALTRAAELQLDIAAGPERAVAATKSYTAQLLTLYLLLDRCAGGDARHAAPLPELGEAVLARAPELAVLAQRYRFAQRLVVTARGYSYPTAREAALKLMETCYVSAHAYSGADLLHGPLAVLDRDVPAIAVMSDGPGGAAMRAVLPKLRAAGADLFCVGAPRLLEGCAPCFALPGGIDDSVAPILEILPLQLLTLQLALARGGNPDAPRGLAKVTETL